MTTSTQQSATPGAMSVGTFAVWAGLGRTTAWKEIRQGRLRAVKVCSRTLVTMADAERWLHSRPSALEFRAGANRGVER